MMRHPLSDAFLQASRHFHRAYERPLIQYQKRCSEHDEEYSYRFRRNHTCEHKSREFDVTVKTNSFGLRDSEDSLEKPEVIILGDTYVMGWGVEEKETFASQLEKQLQKKILAVGQPSYESARQFKMFNELDRSNLKLLVIAYNQNDYRLNLLYKRIGNHMRLMMPQDYEVYVHRHQQALRPLGSLQYTRFYTPFLYHEFRKKKRDEMSEKKIKKEKKHSKREAMLFLNTMHAIAEKDIYDVPILITEINGFNENDSYFLNALEEYMGKGAKKLFGEKLPDFHYLDLSQLLKDEHYYTLEDHLNPTGHKVVAEALAPEMESLLAVN